MFGGVFVLRVLDFRWISTESDAERTTPYDIPENL